MSPDRGEGLDVAGRQLAAGGAERGTQTATGFLPAELRKVGLAEIKAVSVTRSRIDVSLGSISVPDRMTAHVTGPRWRSGPLCTGRSPSSKFQSPCFGRGCHVAATGKGRNSKCRPRGARSPASTPLPVPKQTLDSVPFSSFSFSCPLKKITVNELWEKGTSTGHVMQFLVYMQEGGTECYVFLHFCQNQSHCTPRNAVSEQEREAAPAQEPSTARKHARR